MRQLSLASGWHWHMSTIGKQGLTLPRPAFKPSHPYLIALIGFAVALGLFGYVFPASPETYKPLRGSLFTGFFTVSGFLLSAKALVILNMKKEVYEKEEYLRKIHQIKWSNHAREKKVGRMSRLECGDIPNVYAPLAQVGTLLSVNIVLALVASFSQITLGLAESIWSTAICLSLAMATALLLACSVYIMWRNFRALYADWEVQAQAKLDGMWEQSMTEFHKSAVQPSAEPLPEIQPVPKKPPPAGGQPS